MNKKVVVADHVVPWSLSKIKCWEQCAAKYKFKYIDRIPEPQAEAAARGEAMHKNIEDFIKGYGFEEIPAPEPLHDTLLKLRHDTGGWRGVEVEVAVTKDWEACGYRSEQAYGRGKFDAVWHDKQENTVEVYEWKSGKPWPEHADQRKLYAAFALRWWLVPEVSVTTVYLDETGPPQRLIVKESGGLKVQKEWEQKVELVRKDKVFAANPQYLCRWCGYSRFKGGPCKVG